MMKQETAFTLLKTGRNIFLTGAAGSGKTTVLKRYIEFLQDNSIPVAVTASTGIAATQLNGVTIHSWSGIGISDNLSQEDLAGLEKNKRLVRKLQGTAVLIIDEISMLHREQLDLVNRVLKYIRKSDQAFGGMKVVFCGDFFQLPPVGKKIETAREKFCFMSSAWTEAALSVCYLSEQYRQTDNILTGLLNRIRSGSITQDDTETLALRTEGHAGHNAEDQHTMLFTHNADVDRINRTFLGQLETESMFFEAETDGSPALCEQLKKSVLTDTVLELKAGARVMFIRNNQESGYMNGSTGIIEGFSDEGMPLVILKDGSLIEAYPEEWTIRDEKGKELAVYRQIPLRLAWAITVHKSQGMTLDSAVVDLSSAFEKGQGYVALSRLRDINDLKLTGLNATAFEVDDLARKADIRFRELSTEVSNLTEGSSLKEEVAQFIQTNSPGKKNRYRIGGKLRRRKKEEEKRPVKKNTYEQTAELIRSGKDLNQIAEIRNFSRSTLIGHITKLKQTDPDLQMDRIRPESQVLEEVGNVLHELSSADPGFSQSVRLTPIHEKLQGKISFEDIRLALLFLQDS